MADEVHELAVKLTPEGGGETRRELENTRGEFETTTDEVGESAGILDDFASKWVGAGLLFAGTLGTLTAAIASRMPVLEEVGESVDLVLTSLALKIDNDVRPSVNELNDDLADLATEIDEADGSADALGITLAGLANTLAERDRTATLDMVVDFSLEVGQVFLDRQRLQEQFKKQVEEQGIKGLFEDFFANFFPLPTIGAKLVKRLAKAGFEAGFEFGQSFDSSLLSESDNLGSRLIEGIKSDIESVDVFSSIEKWINEKIRQAPSWGRKLIDRLIRGIKEEISNRELPFGLGTVGDLTGMGGGREVLAQNVTATPVGNGTAGGNQTLNAEFFLDGREASRSQSRYRNDSTNRRGRYG